MKVVKNGKKIKVTDDNKVQKVVTAKHKGKKYSQLSQPEKNELLLAVLLLLNLVDKNEVIK